MPAIRIAILCLLSLVTALAHAGNLADVTILDRNTGERLTPYQHHGVVYVAGRPGNRYAVAITNRTGGRLLAIVSVDGVNAITGETAAGNQSGYVLDGYQRMEVAGWRKSLDDVAAFYFTPLPDAYAARTNRPDNVGVIGVAVFREYEEPKLSRQEAVTANTMDSAKRAAEAPAAAGATLGTGHGERVGSQARYTEFRRAGNAPNEVLTIRYDSHANLVARGIIAPVRTPNAFPGGFVPDPRG